MICSLTTSKTLYIPPQILVFNFFANYFHIMSKRFFKQSQKRHEKNELENTYYFPTISNLDKFFVSFCWCKWDKVIVNAEST